MTLGEVGAPRPAISVQAGELCAGPPARVPTRSVVYICLCPPLPLPNLRPPTSSPELCRCTHTRLTGPWRGAPPWSEGEGGKAGSQVDSLPAEMVPAWHTCLRSALGAPAGLTSPLSSIFQGDGASEAAHATNCASCPFPGGSGLSQALPDRR